MINRVVLVGRLTRDPELRVAGERKVCNFTLAVKRPFSQGSQTDFIPCVAWSIKAELLEKYTHKGDLIGVDGSIQTRSYENKDGNRVNVVEVNADTITFLSTKNDNTGDYTNESDYTNKYSTEPKTSAQADKKAPSSENGSIYQSNLLDETSYQNKSQLNIDDEDLPF